MREGKGKGGREGQGVGARFGWVGLLAARFVSALARTQRIEALPPF